MAGRSSAAGPVVESRRFPGQILTKFVIWAGKGSQVLKNLILGASGPSVQHELTPYGYQGT